MKITITNTSWQRKVLLHNATVYFARKLSGFRKKRIKILIKVVAGLQSIEHCRGMAHRNTPLSFEIRLDSKLKPISLIKCLSHELIHVQQWLTGQMEDLFASRFSVRWGKRKYYPSHLAYDRHPWEIQAHKFEKDLYNSWVKFWKS